MKKISTILKFSIFLPSIAFAQTGGLLEYMTSFGGLLKLFVPIIFGLSLVYFFWGGAKFVLNAGDEKYRADGKNKLIWGIIALFVFVSILGILSTIGDLLDIDTPNIQGTTPPIYAPNPNPFPGTIPI